MPTYHANEFTLDLPRDLHDKTVHIFAMAEKGPSDLSLVVARERPAEGEALEAFVERVLATLSVQLPGLVVLERRTVEVDGERALQTDYTWQSTQGKMFQRQVVAPARPHDLMLLITGTCRDQMSPDAEQVMAAFVAGLRFRGQPST